MKHTHNNPATHFAMLLMALAMAFTISCESEEEKQAKAESAARAARMAAAAEKVAAKAEAARAKIKAKAKAEKTEAMLKSKAACPNKIGRLQTAEAVFLGSTCEGILCAASFSLSDEEEIILLCKDTDVIEMILNIKEGAKVSVTYQNEQRWIANHEVESENGCDLSDVLKSMKILHNGNEEASEPSAGFDGL
jgi:nucleoid-associated protein YgaU